MNSITKTIKGKNYYSLEQNLTKQLLKTNLSLTNVNGYTMVKENLKNSKREFKKCPLIWNEQPPITYIMKELKNGDIELVVKSSYSNNKVSRLVDKAIKKAS